MWYLILTLSMGIEGGVSVTVTPFDSYKTCMEAATLWLQDTNRWTEASFTRIGTLRRAQCSAK